MPSIRRYGSAWQPSQPWFSWGPRQVEKTTLARQIAGALAEELAA